MPNSTAASFRLEALDESLFVARPGEDQSFPAVFQRDQPHRRIREKRQQLGVGEALDGLLLRRWRSRRNGRTWRSPSLEGEHGCGQEGQCGEGAQGRAAPSPSPEDATAGDQSGLAAGMRLIEQGVDEFSFLRFHG